MASNDSSDNISLTPHYNYTTTKRQHSLPKTLSKEDLNQYTDHTSDQKRSSTEQTDGQGRTYSYMSPISSDDDVAEQQARRESVKSLDKKKPKKRIMKAIKGLSLAKIEAEPDEEMAQKERSHAGKRATNSEQEARNGITNKAKCIKRPNNKHANSHVTTNSISETFSDESSARAPVAKTSKGKCPVSTGVARVAHIASNSNSSGARLTTKSEDEDAKDFAEHGAKNCAGKFQKRIKHRHSGSAPSDRKKEGESPRKANPIECEICGRSIRCKAVLERHMLSHTGEKPFECDVCGKHYTSSSNLRIHQLSHSGKMDYACNECGQKFTHLPYLKRHLLRHSGKKMHICEHCGRGFIQKYHLLRHILVHTRQTPHTCDKCGMSFNRTDYLKLHLRNVHLIGSNTSKAKEEKLYQCEMCTKSFANHNSLETHKRTHTGSMPYSCIVCSRQFKQSSHLYSHMFTHSSEKPHACNLCELKFTRKCYLRKHKERVHSGGGGDAQSF